MATLVTHMSTGKKYVLLGAGPGAAADIEHVAYDLDGPYAPP